MNTTNAPAPQSPRLHPLLATAAIAVTTLSLAGIAAITGLLPYSKAEEPPLPPQTAATAAPQAVPAAGHFIQPTPTIAEAANVTKPKVVEKIIYVDKPAAVPKLAAQTPPPPPAGNPPAPPAVTVASAPVCMNCGAIDNIREVAQPGEASGLGAVIGGVAGGLLGSQVGGGSGNKIATVLGAAGGAYTGHQVEKSRKETKRYEVSVRMEDGSVRSVMQDSVPAWRIGDRVRVENETLSATN